MMSNSDIRNNNYLNYFDIGKYGFLNDDCVRVLPDSMKHFQTVLNNLPSNKCPSSLFRKYVNNLPNFENNKNLYEINYYNYLFPAE